MRNMIILRVESNAPISCKAKHYSIPCRRVLQNSVPKFTNYEYVIVRLEFSDGNEGVGSTYTQRNRGAPLPDKQGHGIVFDWEKLGAQPIG
jgi:hypothetical protein